MSEDEKIRKVIEKYSNFFKDYSADVGQTVNGAWFFLEYDSKHDDYYCFTRFSTAEELENLIIGLVADDVNCQLETTVDSISHNLQSYVINDLPAQNYNGTIPELIKTLKAFNQICTEGSGKINKIFELLTTNE